MSPSETGALPNQNKLPLKAAADVAWLVGAYALNAMVTLILAVGIGRSLGAAALGMYAFAVAASRVFYSGADLGIGSHLKRVLARDPSLARKHISVFVTFRLTVIPLAVVCLVAVGVALGMRDVLPIALIAVSNGLLAVYAIHEAFFIVHGKARLVTIAAVVYSLGLVTSGLIWFVCGGSLPQLCGVLVAATALKVFVAWAFARVYARFWPSPDMDLRFVALALKRSIPIGLSVLQAIATLKLPVLILTAYATSRDVGAYAGAEMLVVAATIIQPAVSSVALPRLSRAFGDSPAWFRQMFWWSNGFLLLYGLGFSTIFFFWGGELVSFVFPARDFSQLGGVVGVLAWSVPLILLTHHNIHVFAAANQEKATAGTMLVGLVAVAALVTFLCARMGIEGAAWGVLAGRAVGFTFGVLVCFAKGIYRGHQRQYCGRRHDRRQR